MVTRPLDSPHRKSLVSGWVFVPTCMVFASFAWGVAQEIPGIMLKSMGVSNALVGLTSILALPSAFRFLFGPFIDHRGTKRCWVLVTQRHLVGAMLLLAAISYFASAHDFGAGLLPVLFVLFACISMLSVFQDVSFGGLFLTALDEEEKALFIGVNTAFIRLAIIFSQGFMVMLAGRIEKDTGNTMLGWALCFGVLGAIQLILMVYHHFVLPSPVLDRPVPPEERESFLKVFARFAEVPQAAVILAFVFLYRLGEGLLARMKVPFLMDAPDKGGLGLTLEQVGVMNGIFTVFGMVVGGVIGGYALKHYGLKKLIWPFAILMTAPHAFFVWLAADPHYGVVHLLGFEVNPWALAALMIEALGYGMGFASLGLLQAKACRGPYRATFFALLTGVMTLSWVLAGTLSGFLQMQTGYAWLFTLSIVFAIPGILIIVWLPLDSLEEMGRAEDMARHAGGTDTTRKS